MTNLPGKTESRNRVYMRLGWAFEAGANADLPMSARLLLQVYAQYADMQTGEVCLAQSAIEEAIGCSYRTVIRMTKRLVAAGVLDRTGRSRPGRDLGNIPIYRVVGAVANWGLSDPPVAAPPTALLPGAGQMQMVPVDDTPISRRQWAVFREIIELESGIDWPEAQRRLAADYDLDLTAYAMDQVPARFYAAALVGLKGIKDKILRPPPGGPQPTAFPLRAPPNSPGQYQSHAPRTESPSPNIPPYPDTPSDPKAAAQWAATLAQLELQLPRNTFETWLQDTWADRYTSADKTTLAVVVSSVFIIECLEQRLYQALLRTLRQVTGQRELDLVFTLPPDHPDRALPAPSVSAAPQPVQPVSLPTGNPVTPKQDEQIMQLLQDIQTDTTLYQDGTLHEYAGQICDMSVGPADSRQASELIRLLIALYDAYHGIERKAKYMQEEISDRYQPRLRDSSGRQRRRPR